MSFLTKIQPTPPPGYQAPPKPKGQVGTKIIPLQDNHKFACENIYLAENFDATTMNGIEIPLAERLGIPLKMVLIANYPVSGYVPNENPNQVIKLLGVVCDDAEDENYGCYSRSRFLPMTSGCCFLCRTDGRIFEREQATVLVHYCLAELEPFYDIGKKKPLGEGRKAMVKRAESWMWPEDYAMYWNAYWEKQAKDDEEWRELKNPVVFGLEPHRRHVGNCGCCGTKEVLGGGGEGVAEGKSERLLQCGRCKKQQYCSKEC